MSGFTSHGTVIAMAQSATPTVFADIAELGDISMPGLHRNEHETTSHNNDIDQYLGGVLRRDPVSFPLFFNKAVAGHMLLETAMIANTVDGYKITQPDTQIWICSGFVQAMKMTAPVDGVQTANVTLRFTGKFLLNGQVVG